MFKPATNSIIFHQEHNTWVLYSDPVRIIKADILDEVIPSLSEVENAIKSNHYAAGFISYEAAPAFDKALKVHRLTDFPYLWFGIYKKPEIIEFPEIQEYKSPDIQWQSEISESEYHKSIETVKEYILKGDTYQVNFTFKMHTKANFDSWSYFVKKYWEHPVPYAAYIETDSHSVLSFSPELFFELHDEKIVCKPMKGTAPRGKYNDEDFLISKNLHASEKNRAENIMIVDMLRNDLGKIARTQSVQVENLFTIERYSTVHQMVSTVSAQSTASYCEIFKSLFPCSSITGAPKIRTCEIIKDLEKGPRKVYCGAIGYIHPGKNGRFSVPIRTMLINKGNNAAEYSVGSGIVADSEKKDEFKECISKARIVSKPDKQLSLIETILWEPNSGFFLSDYHIQRLIDSAYYFGFKLSYDQVEEYLKLLPGFYTERMRVRLLYNWHKGLSHSSAVLKENTLPLQVTFAKHNVSSENIYLYHKTTIREHYDSSISAYVGSDDVLQYNERNEITEMTIGNVVALIDGKLITPQFECGVLRGVFRRKLLEDGVIREAVITFEEIKRASKIFRINSVRKWEICEVNMDTAPFYS